MLTCYANALKRKEEDSVYVLIQSNKLVDLEAAKHKWSFRFSDSGPHCISMAAGLHQSDLQKKAKERKKKKITTCVLFSHWLRANTVSREPIPCGQG